MQLAPGLPGVRFQTPGKPGANSARERGMRRRVFAVVAAVVVAGVVAAADKPEVFSGKVVAPAAKGKSEAKARDLELKADDGTSYTIVEDDASAMLFLDERLRNRPVR